jgi:hypothetical protein
MKVIHVTVYWKDDPAMIGDSYEEYLTVDGEVVLRGDYYHDHIGDKIEGYVDGLRKSNDNVEFSTLNLFSDEVQYPEDGDED